MLKTFVLVLSIALSSVPAQAQGEPPANDATQPGNQAGTEIIGFPVYSSDGQHLGQVIQVAMADGKLRAVRAEVGTFLGLGAATVVIDADIVAHKQDRLELAMSADDVKKAINSRPQ